MNRVSIWALAVLAVGCLCTLPRTGTDAARLLPTQVLVIGCEEETFVVQSDIGVTGRGATLAQALAQMTACAPGTLFLDTAEHIVLLQSAQTRVDTVIEQPQFRPAAKLYLALTELPGAEQLVEFLRAHPGKLTLAEAQAARLRSESVEPARLLRTESGGVCLAK